MFLRKECDIDDSFLPLAMSVIGDTGDDVDGVENLGPARFLEIFPQLVSLTGDMNKIYDKIENKQPLLDSIPPSISNKHLRKVVDGEVANNIVSNNLRLVSFELISRALDNPDKTEMIDKRTIIENVIKDEKVYPVDALKAALAKTGVFLEESSIDFLYI
jgi:hypothetical protein